MFSHNNRYASPFVNEIVEERIVIVDYVKFRDNALLMAEDGYIPVFGEFNEPLAEIVGECIWKIKRSGKKEATLLIDSGGGKNVAFNTMRSTMIESGLTFRGLVLGRACSNGFNILQACHTRESVSGAYFMYHWGTAWLGNNELDALINGEQWVIDFVIEMEMNTMRFISERTGIPIKELKTIAKQERYYPAKFALKANMIDRIINHVPLAIIETMKEVRKEIPTAEEAPVSEKKKKDKKSKK
ncbi:ATP-dependent Clp protease proteolytic subunit [Candidatus Woesebacteria bacterium]|nr:ATP-dependent Clp protease proteolytic subunit [Candidatus Woesebacteria bacterium]MBP9687705.1 ATP-dependent Clp protease proteolytic subunit [Candidatus Woesebacteria bacterium]